jgi:hypothetical protein
MIFYNRAWVTAWLKKNLLFVLFIAGVFAGYAILMAWWNYLGPQVRHILAFLLPFLFTAAFVLERLPNRTLRPGKGMKSVDVLFIFNLVVSVMVLYDIHANLFHLVTTLSAGS